MKALQRLGILAIASLSVSFASCDLNHSDSSDSTASAIPSGAAAEWLFSGSAADSEGVLTNAVTGAALAADRKGKADSAYSFDGSSAYISVNDATAINLSAKSFSISVWVKSAGTQANNAGIMSRYQGYGTAGYFIRAKSNGAIDVGAAVDYSTTSTPLTSTSWQHIVWTCAYDATTPANTVNKVYVDGVEQTLSTSVFDPQIAINNTDPLCFGVDFSSNFFSGSIDDVRIYDRVLSAEEVGQLYNE